MILFGAIETIESMVLNTVMLLLDHPEQLARCARTRELIPNAVEESLRLIPPVTFIERWSSAPTVVGDVALGAGEFVGVSTLGANRDPEVFADPLRFDIRRAERPPRALVQPRRAPLRRLLDGADAGPVAMESILRRLPGLRMEEVERPAGFVFRKPAILRLRWQA